MESAISARKYTSRNRMNQQYQRDIRYEKRVQLQKENGDKECLTTIQEERISHCRERQTAQGNPPSAYGDPITRDMQLLPNAGPPLFAVPVMTKNIPTKQAHNIQDRQEVEKERTTPKPDCPPNPALASDNSVVETRNGLEYESHHC